MKISLDELLKKKLTDEIIIFPTDTVYGIGCRMDSATGVEKIYAVKRREGKKPLPVLVGNRDDAKRLSENFATYAAYADAHWPGALTLVVRKSQAVPDYVTRGLDTVGLRIPDNAIARAILNRFGPMAVTSLNHAHEPPITRFADAEAFATLVDYTLEGGNLKTVSSTVFDVENRKTLRQGTVVVHALPDSDD